MSMLARLTASLAGAALVTLAQPVVTRAQSADAPRAVAPPARTDPATPGTVFAPAGPVRAPAAAGAVPAVPASAPTAVSVPAPALFATRTPPPPPPAAPPASAAPVVRAARARPAIAAEPPRAERARNYVSKGVNIRIDATVTEQRADQVLGKKVVTVTVVDGRSGLVRSTQQVPYRIKGTNGFNYQNAPLNMDAEALLRDDGRVLVSLTLDYRGGPSEGGTETETLDQGIRQSVTVVLDSGKPLVVAQSADAVGDRRVMLELTATILK